VAYVASESDSKAVYFNLLPAANGDDNDGFLERWKQVIAAGLEATNIWGEDEVDALGRPTLSTVVNHFNELCLLTEDDEGARALFTALSAYRDIWGGGGLARWQAAAKSIHHSGYRLSQVRPQMLRKLKRTYCDAELGLEDCPEEDRIRETDEEIEAELSGNEDLREQLMEEVVGQDDGTPLRRRLIEAFRRQREGG